MKDRATIYSRTTIYFHFFIVFVLIPHVFYFSYSEIIARFLISAAFWGAGFILGWYIFWSECQRCRACQRVALFCGNTLSHIILIKYWQMFYLFLIFCCYFTRLKACKTNCKIKGTHEIFVILHVALCNNYFLCNIAM